LTPAPTGGIRWRIVGAPLPCALGSEMYDLRLTGRAAAPCGPGGHQRPPLLQEVAPRVGPFHAPHDVRQRPLGHLPALGPRLAAPVPEAAAEPVRDHHAAGQVAPARR